jgi:hypothetical protein
MANLDWIDSALEEIRTRLLAEILGVDPGQIDIQFVCKVEKRIMRDPLHASNLNRKRTRKETKIYKARCREYAQRALRTGPTSST